MRRFGHILVKDLRTPLLNTNKVSRLGFTLAEVLITLGIIGVVAAMTLPSLISNYNKQVEFNQFKKTYSILSQLWASAEADLGTAPNCGYWASNGSNKSPYNGNITVVTTYDSNGNASYKQQNEDGSLSSLPSDYNGRFADCNMMKDSVLSKLKIIKTCKGNAYRDKCIGDLSGIDDIAGESYDENSDPFMNEEGGGSYDYYVNRKTAGTSCFRKNNILTRSYAYVTSGGMTLIGPCGEFTPRYFMVDTNGPKGPNKWGYDVFSFSSYMYDSSYGIYLKGSSYKQKGGTSSADMILKVGNVKK